VNEESTRFLKKWLHHCTCEGGREEREGGRVDKNSWERSSREGCTGGGRRASTRKGKH